MHETESCDFQHQHLKLLADFDLKDLLYDNTAIVTNLMFLELCQLMLTFKNDHNQKLTIIFVSPTIVGSTFKFYYLFNESPI